MNKWREELRRAFDAPQPMRKRAFLRNLNAGGMSVSAFLVSQIGYIRKRVWCVCAAIAAVSVFGAVFLPDTVLWLISGLTPLLVLTIIAESGRSEYYQMAELEMATRFSLRSVTLARLAILGTVSLLLLGILVPIGLCGGTAAPVAAVLYIVTPFLLSAYAGLLIVRKLRGQEAMYICTGVSAGISMFLLLSHSLTPFIYQERCLAAWITAALVLLIGSGKEYRSIIKRTEDLAWSLSQTV